MPFFEDVEQYMILLLSTRDTSEMSSTGFTMDNGINIVGGLTADRIAKSQWNSCK